MAFNHSNKAKASHCTFTDVGRDANVNLNGRQAVHIRISGPLSINFSLFGARHTPLSILHNDHDKNTLTWTPTTSEISPQSSEVPILMHHLPEGIDAITATTRLTIEIVNLLMVPQAEEPHKELRLELTALNKSLVMTGEAIQEYKDRSLGQSLINAITPEVKRCRIVLEELFDRVDGTRCGLNRTSIQDLWRSVWWSRWSGEELVLLRTKLSQCRESLRRFLMALNSVAWTDIGNDLCTGPVSLRKFHTLLRQYLPSLQHIQLETLSVVDHLGQNIPVPTMFCSTWKDFDHIITGYCKGRVGIDYVEKGDYQVINPTDNKKIDSVGLPQKVKPGMILEMSIVVRLRSASQDNKARCPRCRHVNSKSTPNNGWIEWKAENADVSDDEDGGNGTTAVRDSLEFDEEHAGRLGEGSHKETVSPAVIGSFERKDQTLFFRRINVIYTQIGKLWDLCLNPWINAYNPHPDFFFNLASNKFMPLGIGPGFLPPREMNQPATHPPLTSLIVFCMPIPQWPIVVKYRPPSSILDIQQQPLISLSDVLVAVHQCLHRRISHMDWAKLGRHEERTITKWYLQRCGMDEKFENQRAQGVKRVDYLNGKTRMVGLIRSGVDDGIEVMELILTDL